jgi:hypothetical protein
MRVMRQGRRAALACLLALLLGGGNVAADGDTSLSWASLLGGGGLEQAYYAAIGADADGNVVVAGETWSEDFPTTDGAMGASLSGPVDGFVAKFSADGTTLLWSTYLGGSGDDNVTSLKVDAEGCVYVVGTTNSSDFPTTSGAYQTAPAVSGAWHAFFAKISADGSTLLYATLLGGGGVAVAAGLDIDGEGRVYVAGRASSDFPTTPGCYDASAPDRSLFVAILNPAGEGSQDLVYSTFISADRATGATAIAVDGEGDVHVTGWANTYYEKKEKGVVFYPTTSSAFLPSISPAQNTYGEVPVYSKLRPAGNGSSDLLYSTFVSESGGGNRAYGVAVDEAGRTYVVGGVKDTAKLTASADAVQQKMGGHRDAFLSVYDSSASGSASRPYCTFFGGSGQDQWHSVAIAPDGRVLLTGVGCFDKAATGKGKSVAVPYPTTSDAVQTKHEGETDVAVTVLDLTKSGSQQLVYSTIFGGGPLTSGATGRDWGMSVTALPSGGMAILGMTNATTDFPDGVNWAYQGPPASGYDAIVLVFNQ